jgi:hypothetical protein
MRVPDSGRGQYVPLGGAVASVGERTWPASSWHLSLSMLESPSILEFASPTRTYRFYPPPAVKHEDIAAKYVYQTASFSLGD